MAHIGFSPPDLKSFWPIVGQPLHQNISIKSSGLSSLRGMYVIEWMCPNKVKWSATLMRPYNYWHTNYSEWGSAHWIYCYLQYFVNELMETFMIMGTTVPVQSRSLSLAHLAHAQHFPVAWALSGGPSYSSNFQLTSSSANLTGRCNFSPPTPVLSEWKRSFHCHWTFCLLWQGWQSHLPTLAFSIDSWARGWALWDLLPSKMA